MAGKRGRKPAQNQTAALLVTALDFLSAVPDTTANPNLVIINGPLATVNDGLLKAGIMIGGEFPRDVVAKIQVSALSGALARVGKEMQIGFGDEFVTLDAGEFKADLISHPIDMIADRVLPDPELAPLNNEFRNAVVKAGVLASDTAEELMMATVAVLGPTVMATKRHTVIEAWHGNNMPSGIYLPKAFVKALAKVKFDLKGFGFSDKTFTVYFEGGAFLQTNTYADAWEVPGKEPGFAINLSYQLLSDAEGVVFSNPKKLGDDLRAIMAVTKSDVAVMLGKMMSTDGQATLDTPEMLESFIIDPSWYVNVTDLITSAKLVKSWEPWTIRFQGDMLRGAMIVKMTATVPTGAPAAAPAPSPAWGSAPPANPTSARPVTLPTSAPAATPASPSPTSGSGPTAPLTASPSEGFTKAEGPMPEFIPPGNPFPPSSGGFSFGGDDE